MKHIFKQCSAALLSGLILISGLQAPQRRMETYAASNLLAFPGAVGGGKYATGGRGGEVYHVTNLNDSGAGSFRDAVSKPNRIVVFDVSGTIELQSNIVCTDNITIAGQTAPGGSGVTLKNYKFGMGGDNIIVRYISSRPGPDKSTSSGNDGWGGAKGSNSMIDHCSLGWTTDEQWGLYSNNDHYTVQYSVIGPANSWGGHVKGIHGFGLMMGRSNLTFDHNLIIHNVSRNFRGKVVGTETADFTNNIIYDWGYQTAYGTIGHVNYVNNTLKAGNSTTGGYHYVQVQSSDNFMIYMNGNRILNKDNSVRNAEDNNWSAMQYKHSDKNRSNTEVTTPFTIMQDGENLSTALTCESASDSYDHVISFAGNGISPEKRTKIDQQCADETKNGTGQCSGTEAYDSSQSGLSKYNIKCGVKYEYPAAVTQKEITDADNDGMADDWELARGLNPNDPADYKGDYCGQGYMNIEYYINDLTVDSFPAGVVELSPENAEDPISAFDTIDAEDYASMSGIRIEENAACSGGKDIGYVENGDYIMFRKVDFADGARSFTAKLSGNMSGIELYLDSISGTPKAKLSFSGTSGFSDFTEQTWNIPAISGQHNLYLKFTGGDGYLLNLDCFTFGKEAIPVNGRVIKNLQILDETYASGWVLADDAKDGTLMYGDRDVTFTNLPEALNGAEYLRTACDSKNTDADLVSFKVEQDADIYIGLDNRVTTAPAWLSDYTKTDLTFGNSNGVTYIVYKKSLHSGDTVTLGTNGQSSGCVNYTVFVDGTERPASVAGDVNMDGSFDIADVVLLQKWLLAVPDTHLADWKAVDLCEDDMLDVYDLCLMKRALIHN